MPEIRNTGGGGGGVDLLPLTNTWSGTSNTFQGLLVAETGLNVGVSGATPGLIRLFDDDSSFRTTLAIPSVGLTSDHTIVWPDIDGNVFIVGDKSSPATAAGTMAAVNITGRTTAVGSTVLAKTCPAGMYMLMAYLLCTTAGAGNLTLNLAYTDESGAQAKSPAGPLVLNANKVSTQVSYPFFKSSTADVSWSTTLSGRTTDVHSIRLRLTFMGP